MARDTGLCSTQIINATVDLVDGVGAGTGTGYAAFRMASQNGYVDGEYPTNIHVGEVRAIGGGRGIFCVSGSGGALSERVEIADTGSNAVLIENCHNVTIASEGGTIEGPGTSASPRARSSRTHRTSRWRTSPSSTRRSSSAHAARTS